MKSRGTRGADVKVKGLAELQKYLDALPVKLETNVMRSALRQGANVVMAEAKLQAPVKSGKLRNSLKVGTRLKRGAATATVRSKLRYANLVEFGTQPHRIAPKKGKALKIGDRFVSYAQHRGAAKKPFLRPALDSQAQNAVIAVGRRIQQVLEKKHGIDTSHVKVEGDE